MKKSRFWLLFLTLTLLSLASVTTVFAAPPVIETFHEEGTNVVDCGSFTAVASFVRDTRVITFFDESGNPVSVQVHINYDGTLTNSVTGLTLRDPGHLTIQEDLQAGTVTFIGLGFGITVPGEGVALFDVGKIVLDVDGNITFEAGPHQFFHGSEALICAALD